MKNSKEIKLALLNGEQFGNEAANWFTICRIKENLFMLVIDDENIFFNNIDKYARRILKLIKTGN